MSSGKWRPFCLGLNVLMSKENLRKLVQFSVSTAKSCGICRYSGDLIRDLYLNLPLDKMAAILETILSYCVFVNKEFYIVIQIWLKFVSKGPIDNNPVQV